MYRQIYEITIETKNNLLIIKHPFSIKKVVRPAGIEPALPGLKDRCLTNLATSGIYLVLATGLEPAIPDVKGQWLTPICLR